MNLLHLTLSLLCLLSLVDICSGRPKVFKQYQPTCTFDEINGSTCATETSGAKTKRIGHNIINGTLVTAGVAGVVAATVVTGGAAAAAYGASAAAVSAGTTAAAAGTAGGAVILGAGYGLATMGGNNMTKKQKIAEAEAEAKDSFEAKVETQRIADQDAKKKSVTVEVKNSQIGI
jgi:hypothetical protein